MKLEIKHREIRRLWFVAVALGVMTSEVSADNVAGLADPTRPAYSTMTAGTTSTKPAGPVLQSTFVSASQRRAVISGKTYVVGDKYGGGVISDIQPYEVVLKKSGNTTRLRLLPKLAKETYGIKAPMNSHLSERAN